MNNVKYVDKVCRKKGGNNMFCKECKEAFYGQGFDNKKCLGCGKTINSVHTPCMDYCEECSKKLNICEQCGKNL